MVAARCSPSTRAAAHCTFVARAVSSEEREILNDAFRLRAAVFAHELSWVDPPSNDREHDRADPLAHHFALFDSGDTHASVIGYARVLLPPAPFMLEREFIRLLSGGPVPGDPVRSFEVSRFAVHPLWRGRYDRSGHSASDHLGRSIVQWAWQAERSVWFSVCEVRHVRALRCRGFAFEPFGAVIEYQPGVHACAVRFNLDMALERLRAQRPDEFDWYCGRPKSIPHAFTTPGGRSCTIHHP